MTWAAPAANGGSAITGYVVTPYMAGVAQATQTFNNTATTETVTGLTNGTSLHLHGGRHQRRRHRGGLGRVQLGHPGHDTGRTHHRHGHATATPRPRSPGRPRLQRRTAVTGYVVTPYIAGVAQATQTFNNTATTETVTGLTNGTAYTFTVAAINGVGTGAPRPPPTR